MAKVKPRADNPVGPGGRRFAFECITWVPAVDRLPALGLLRKVPNGRTFQCLDLEGSFTRRVATSCLARARFAPSLAQLERRFP